MPGPTFVGEAGWAATAAATGVRGLTGAVAVGEADEGAYADGGADADADAEPNAVAPDVTGVGRVAMGSAVTTVAAAGNSLAPDKLGGADVVARAS